MHCYIRQHFRLESSHVIHSEPKKKGGGNGGWSYDKVAVEG